MSSHRFDDVCSCYIFIRLLSALKQISVTLKIMRTKQMKDAPQHVKIKEKRRLLEIRWTQDDYQWSDGHRNIQRMPDDQYQRINL